eukprot:61357_1
MGNSHSHNADQHAERKTPQTHTRTITPQTYSENKVHLSIICIGHRGCGKSTLCKYLLEELKQSVKVKQEPKQSPTIKCSYDEFFTDFYHYTLIDAPGNKKYIKNMINGTAQADIAILIVPSSQDEFEASIAKGNHKKGIPQGETIHHARLCHLMGI